MSTEPHAFDRQSAERIAHVVHAVERNTRRALPLLQYRRPVAGGLQLLLGKTAGYHAKGATAQVFLYAPADDLTPGNEQPTGKYVLAYNRFADVMPDSWVFLLHLNGHYELFAAETFQCLPAEDDEEADEQ